MEASSDGYGPDTLYRRTCLVVDRGPAGSYLLDIFRVSGGRRADYLFHGPHENYRVTGLDLGAEATEAWNRRESLGEAGPALAEVRQGRGDAPWSVTWTFDDGTTFEAFVPACAHERVFAGKGWGQRDHRNTDLGATLPYFVRRREGGGWPEVFVSAFAGDGAGRRLVEAIQVLPLPAGAPPGTAAVEVRTAQGIDVVVSMLDPAPIAVRTDAGELSADGRVAAILAGDGSPSSACLIGGTRLSTGGLELKAPKGVLSGRILSRGSEAGRSWFEIDGAEPTIRGLRGQTLFAIQDGRRHGYPIRAVEPAAGGCRVFTKTGGQGFEARSAAAWDLPVTVSWKRAKE
jgi:hypothetical protein